MIPYIKYYVAKNPAFGKPFDPVVAPTVEEWEDWVKYGKRKPTVIPDYDEFAKIVVERKTRSLEQSAKCEFTIQKVAISEESDIKKVEEQEDFVRWHRVEE
jgi:hypothetical protein